MGISKDPGTRTNESSARGAMAFNSSLAKRTNPSTYLRLYSLATIANRTASLSTSGRTGNSVDMSAGRYSFRPGLQGQELQEEELRSQELQELQEAPPKTGLARGP